MGGHQPITIAACVQVKCEIVDHHLHTCEKWVGGGGGEGQSIGFNITSRVERRRFEICNITSS